MNKFCFWLSLSSHGSINEIDLSTIHDKYSWNKHIAYDKLTKDWGPILNYSYIDMSPLYLRIDAHPASNGYGKCAFYTIALREGWVNYNG